jgi:phenylalanyl-tRNA synthetase alpha chain
MADQGPHAEIWKHFSHRFLGEATPDGGHPILLVGQAGCIALAEAGFSLREWPANSDWLRDILDRERPPIRELSLLQLGSIQDPSSSPGSSPRLHAIAVERGLSLAQLKTVALSTLSRILGDNLKPIFSPIFLPTFAPGFSLQIEVPKTTRLEQNMHESITRAIKPQGSGAETTLISTWLEVGIAGMIHPDVFESVDYDSDIYTGFILELRLDHLAWLKSQHR